MAKVPEKHKGKAVSIMLTPDLIQKLDSIARAQDRSRSSIIRRWIEAETLEQFKR